MNERDYELNNRLRALEDKEREREWTHRDRASEVERTAQAARDELQAARDERRSSHADITARLRRLEEPRLRASTPTTPRALRRAPSSKQSRGNTT